MLKGMLASAVSSAPLTVTVKLAVFAVFAPPSVKPSASASRAMVTVTESSSAMRTGWVIPPAGSTAPVVPLPSMVSTTWKVSFASSSESCAVVTLKSCSVS